MRVAILGTGMIGAAIVHELSKTHSSYIDEIIAVDKSEEYLNRCLKDINSDIVSGKLADFDNHESLVHVLSEVDIAIGCLPHSLSLQITKAAIDAKCHIVDLVGSNYVEKKSLHEEAERAGVLIVPGCGVAPGIVNILAGRGAELLDEADEAVMMCGGIPKEPLPPLMYQIVFRLESAIGLYTKRATAAKNGEIIELTPFTGLENIDFPQPVGKCEAIYSDAHSTAYTLKDKIKNIYEKTIRYEGHFEKMKVLHELGFLEDTPVKVKNNLVSPKQLTMSLLEPQLSKGSKEDITVLRVTVKGRKNGENTVYTWEMVNQYDKERQLTSMAKTTGFPAIIVTEFIAQGKIKEVGVLSPEEIIVSDLFDQFINKLTEMKINIKEIHENH